MQRVNWKWLVGERYGDDPGLIARNPRVGREFPPPDSRGRATVVR